MTAETATFPQADLPPGLILTEATPPVQSHDSLPVVEDNRDSISPIGPNGPLRLDIASAILDPNRQLTSVTANSIIPDSQTGWERAVKQAVQRDEDFVDEWQRSMDVLLIFVSSHRPPLAPADSRVEPRQFIP
jgi:hypothetical protein